MDNLDFYDEIDRKILTQTANSKSPRFLWMRWGYACINSSLTEMRIYRKNENNEPVGSCLYRSFYARDKEIWLHRNVDTSPIIIIDIPGNSMGFHSYKKDWKTKQFLRDSLNQLIPAEITTNVSLAITFEREFLYRQGNADYQNYGYRSAVELIMEYGESMDDYCKNIGGNWEKTKYFMPAMSAAAPDNIFTNKRIFLHTCDKDAARLQGLDYLRQRAISERTASIFEKASILYYNKGSKFYYPCIAFCGWQKITEINGIPLPVPAHEPALISKRLLTSSKSDMREKDSFLKGCMFGSKLKYVPFFKGVDRTLAVVVEGGVDMLSVAEMCLKNNIDIPTIIMTSGCGNTQFWNNNEIVETLSDTKKIIFIGDNDFHLSENERQKIQRHLEQNKQKAMEITQNVEIVYPNIDICKDANDMLKHDLRLFADMVFHNNLNLNEICKG